VKYDRFEDLPVWNAAIDLAVRAYAVTRDRFFAQPGDLRDQIRRAALSVSNNVAEGFERGSTAELLAFLYIARGSAGEVRSMLCFVERTPEAEHLKSQVLHRTCVAISRLMPAARHRRLPRTLGTNGTTRPLTRGLVYSIHTCAFSSCDPTGMRRERSLAM
jgi:four helix bundle protein